MTIPESTQGDSSAEEDIAATRRFVGSEAEVVGGGPAHGHFTGVRPNRTQRRHNLKNKDERMILKRIHLEFEDGQETDLDIAKVQIIDRETKAVIFNEVMEAKA